MLLLNLVLKMGEKDGMSWTPTGSPISSYNILQSQQQDHWRNFDNSVNAVSFGFVATAILISMFLVMAIFERFLRPTSPALTAPSGSRSFRDIESQIGFNAKFGHPPSPKITANAKEVSVLMPGEDIPTFIAHPAPVPCPPERISCPSHQHIALPNFTPNSNSNTSSTSI